MYSLDIVLAVCTLECTYMPALQKEIKRSGVLRIRNVWVYNKCGMRNNCSTYATHVIADANVGRCDHTFASHIALHHKTLAHYTIFGKDSLRDYNPPSVAFHRMTSDMLTSFTRVGCAYKTSAHLHKNFPNTTYAPKRRQRVPNVTDSRNATVDFLSVQFPKMDDFWWQALGLSTHTVQSWCYKGWFGVARTAIHRHPPRTYASAAFYLSRGDNIIESHYMERAWYQLFA